MAFRIERIQRHGMVGGGNACIGSTRQHGEHTIAADRQCAAGCQRHSALQLRARLCEIEGAIVEVRRQGQVTLGELGRQGDCLARIRKGPVNFLAICAALCASGADYQRPQLIARSK
jgi:hypothetical protein